MMLSCFICLMKNIILFYLGLFSLVSYSQTKKIVFFDNYKKPIANYQLNFFLQDSLSIYKSNTVSNSYYFEQSLLKKVDSIFITFNSFYSEKIDVNDFSKKDTIFLKKEIPLEEIVINKKFERKELGVVSKNRNIFKIGNTSRTDEIIEIDVSDNIGSDIEFISLYIFEKFHDLHNKKHKSENLNIKFYLFQSNNNPNNEIVNLFEQELIVNTKKGNRGWVNVDLRKLNIKIKDYKYLYIGYSVFGNPIAVGAVRRKRIKSNKKITSYIRSSDKVLNRRWRKSHYKIHVSEKELSEPAIKIEIKY